MAPRSPCIGRASGRSDSFSARTRPSARCVASFTMRSPRPTIRPRRQSVPRNAEGSTGRGTAWKGNSQIAKGRGDLELAARSGPIIRHRGLGDQIAARSDEARILLHLHHGYDVVLAGACSPVAGRANDVTRNDSRGDLKHDRGPVQVGPAPPTGRTSNVPVRCAARSRAPTAAAGRSQLLTSAGHDLRESHGQPGPAVRWLRSGKRGGAPACHGARPGRTR